MSELIVKDNALMNASYNLDLVEQRLILLAIVEARESGKGINANDLLQSMQKVISISLAYTEQRHTSLKRCLQGLICTSIQLSRKTRTWTSEYYKSMGITNCLY
jgi:hypothetical protein